MFQQVLIALNIHGIHDHVRSQLSYLALMIYRTSVCVWHKMTVLDPLKLWRGHGGEILNLEPGMKGAEHSALLHPYKETTGIIFSKLCKGVAFWGRYVLGSVHFPRLYNLFILKISKYPEVVHIMLQLPQVEKAKIDVRKPYARLWQHVYTSHSITVVQ